MNHGAHYEFEVVITTCGSQTLDRYQSTDVSSTCSMSMINEICLLISVPESGIPWRDLIPLLVMSIPFLYKKGFVRSLGRESVGKVIG